MSEVFNPFEDEEVAFNPYEDEGVAKPFNPFEDADLAPVDAPVGDSTELSDSIPQQQSGGVILPPAEETQKPLPRNKVDEINQAVDESPKKEQPKTLQELIDGERESATNELTMQTEERGNLLGTSLKRGIGFGGQLLGRGMELASDKLPPIESFSGSIQGQPVGSSTPSKEPQTIAENFEGFGTSVREAGKKLAEDNVTEHHLKEFEWSDLADPNFYLSKGATSLPLILPILGMAIPVGVGATTLATGAGIGAIGASAIGAVASALASRPLESAMEAMGIYNEVIDSGGTPEQAGIAASETFKKNLSLASLDAVEFGLAFAKVNPAARKGLAKYIKAGGKALMAGLTEGAEELVQGYFGEQGKAVALGKPDVDFIESMSLATPEQREQFALGFTMGEFFQASGAVKNSMTKEEVDNLINEIQEEHGVSEEQLKEAEKETTEATTDSDEEATKAFEEALQSITEPQQKELGLEEPTEILPAEEVSEPTQEEIEFGGQKSAKNKPLSDNLSGITKEELAVLEDDLGIDFKASKATANIKTMNDAMAKGLPERAIELAEDLISSGRAASAEEISALNLAFARADNAYRAIRTQIKELEDAGKPVQEKLYEELDKQLIKMTQIGSGVRFGGGEAARAMQSIQTKIDRDTYGIVGAVREGRNAKGKDLTKKQQRELESLGESFEETESTVTKLEEAERATREAEIEPNAKRVVAKAVLANSKKKSNPKTAKDILDKINAIDESQVLLAGKVSPQMASLVNKLAIEHIKNGAKTLDAVVNAVIEDVPALNERQVMESLGGKIKPPKKARSAISKLISSLKKEAKLTVEFSDALDGILAKVEKGQRISTLQIDSLELYLKKISAEIASSELDATRLNELNNQIIKLTDMVELGYRDVKANGRIESDAIKAAKKELSELQSLMNTKDEIIRQQEILKGLKDGTTTDVPEVQKRITDNKELLKARSELKRIKSQIRQKHNSLRPTTVGGLAKDTAGALRAVRATADMSYLVRQGLILGAGHPLLATKAFKNALSATFSDSNARSIDEVMRSSEMQPLRELAGLFMSELDGGITTGEEEFTSKIFNKKIFKITGITATIDASNRNMVIGLNSLRTSVFDNYVKNNPDASIEELKKIASFINVASGRGDFGRLEGTAFPETAAIVMFSPRFALSRIQTATQGVKLLGNKNTAKEAGRIIAGMGVGYMLLQGMAEMAGGEVEKDPNSPEFGKIVLYDNGQKITFDFGGGGIPFARSGARIAMHQYNAEFGTPSQKRAAAKFDPKTEIGRLLGNKVSPIISASLFASAYRRQQKLYGEVPRAVDIPKQFIPLIAEQTIEGIEKELSLGTMSKIIGAEMFGGGVQVYDK